jgi:hypothetical protein
MDIEGKMTRLRFFWLEYEELDWLFDFVSYQMRTGGL